MENKGYTLLEIIISVTILALIIVPVSTLLSQSVLSNTKSKEILIATVLAQEKVEELKALTFDQVCLKLGTHIEENIKVDDLYFDRILQVQLEETDLVKITVKVHGNNGVVHIATYRGNY